MRATVDEAQQCCIDALRSLQFHVTIFGGQRRLLCVKRINGTTQAVRIEVAVEAISKDDSRVTVSAEYGNEATNETILRFELVEITNAVERTVTTRAQSEIGFPMRLMQVCIW